MTCLENEVGGHRIQRVPPTERKGRVHTSTVVVTLTEEVVKLDKVLDDSEFRIEWYSGTGAGGQHRNKHQNSCRLTHIQTGIVATAQCRSRENSLNEAKIALSKRINELRFACEHSNIADIKRKQGGSGERGDKIRTYMFQHGKVTDHNSNKSCQIAKIMNGNFQLLW